MTGIIGSFGASAHAIESSGDAAGAVSVDERGLRLVARSQVLPWSVERTERVIAAACGRPKLGTESPGSGPGHDTLAQIARRFGEVGAGVLSELRGTFSIVLFDRRRLSGLVAVDRVGAGRLFVQAAGSAVVFGSNPIEVARCATGSAAVSAQALYDYLHFHVVPGPHSIIQGPRRLAPGEYAAIGHGQAEFRRYWQMRFNEHRPRPFAELKKEFLEVLGASVSDASAEGNVGAFLSGGTDSSTIAGLMSRRSAPPARTFSIGFDAAGYDEMEYARLAARHFGTQHHEYYVTPADVALAAPLLARLHDEPFGNASAVPTYFCACLARERGCDVMIGGDGGDELFGGNARYGVQRVFERYRLVPRALRAGIIEPLTSALKHLPPLPVLRKLVSYVDQARIDMPARLETYNLLNRLGAASIVDARLLEQVDRDEPLTLQQQDYDNPTAGSLINRMLALDLKITLADNDLPKVIRSCELAGLSVRFPMLDERVVDFSAAMEPDLKLRGTQLRYFFKEALRDFLPPEILAKQKHGFGLPFGHWALADRKLNQLMMETLTSLKSRGLIRPEFIDDLTTRLMPSAPGYYGAMAWVLMMLELWIDAHLAPAGHPVTVVRA